MKWILTLVALVMGSHVGSAQSLDWTIGGTMKELDAMDVKYTKSDCGDCYSLLTDFDDSGMCTRYVFDKIYNSCELIVWYFIDDETYADFIYRLGSDRGFTTLEKGRKWSSLLNEKPTVFEVRELNIEQMKFDFAGKIYVYRESNTKY